MSTSSHSLPSSGRSPLADPVFRMLWLAWLAANMTMWMNEVAAAWLMSQLTDNAMLVALVQAASTLPVFLLGLPCGALADIFDRRRFYAFAQLWIAVVAALLAACAALGWLGAPLLLALTFANGIGLAMRFPVFSAIIPELVPREQMPSALTLNALAMNLSRIAGPIAAGALMASMGTQAVFALNAALSALACVLILRWRSAPRRSELPKERLLGAMRVGLQYAWQSPGLRSIVVRSFVFFGQSIGLIALLPLIAQQRGADATGYTLLLASMGAGAVTAAITLPRLSGSASRDRIIAIGVLLYAAATVGAVLAPDTWLLTLALALSGGVWMCVANTLTMSAQLALPAWVRARGMAIYQMSIMGGSAAGAALWGTVADRAGLDASLLASAVLGIVLMLLTRRVSVQHRDAHDPSPLGGATQPVPAIEVGAQQGPVMVTIEYAVPEARLPEFHELMRRTRQARLRLGALSWGLYRDTDRSDRYVEYFADESWQDHLRRLDRFTLADVELRDLRRSFYPEGSTPLSRRYVADPLPR